MTTSGTVGLTVTDVTTVIEHSARRCGVVASSLTSEQQLSARENLGFILLDLANRGVNLWCVQKYILPLHDQQATYNLPIGTVDLLNTLYRTLHFPDVTDTTSATQLLADFDEDTQVTSIRITADSSTVANLTVEYSDDGITYTPLLVIPTFTMVDGDDYWFDVDGSPSKQFWAIRETVLGSIGASSPLWGNTPQEIDMAKLNRDDYVNLPNKTFTSSRPLQFWYDKQAIQPRASLWPVPDDDTVSVVCYVHRHIEDVGAYTNTLNLPSRWLESIIFTLAHRMSLELPNVKPDRIIYLEQQAEKFLVRAENGETDGAPIRFAPNISPYTR